MKIGITDSLKFSPVFGIRSVQNIFPVAGQLAMYVSGLMREKTSFSFSVLYNPPPLFAFDSKSSN